MSSHIISTFISRDLEQNINVVFGILEASLVCS